MANVVCFGWEELAAQISGRSAGGGSGAGAAAGAAAAVEDGAESKADESAASGNGILSEAAAAAESDGSSLRSVPNALGQYAPDERFDFPSITFEWDREYEHQEAMLGAKDGAKVGQWALLQFESPIHCPIGSTLVGSRLDMDINVTTCRIAFFARIVRCTTSHA